MSKIAARILVGIDTIVGNTGFDKALSNAVDQGG